MPLWLIDWPALAQPAGAQGLLRALGILAGVAGTALWVMSLALMLRFPALDRRFGGLDRQYFAHHLTGTLAYLMLLAVRRQLDRGALAARRFRIEHVERVSPTTVEVTLAPQASQAPFAPFTYAPGQFVFVAFDSGPGYAGCREYHPFTISSAPGAPRFRLFIKALGDCTARIQQLAVGINARVQSPYGGLFLDADFTRPQLWLGGGIGVTPFLSMAAALPASAAGVDFYYLANLTRI